MKRRIVAILAVAGLAALVATYPGLVRGAAASKAEPSLNALIAAGDWIGTPETRDDLRGKVVVLDVFTVDCYNCQNVVPVLRSLDATDRARGLRVVGIHAPETPAERERAYVIRSLRRQGITWPVVVDNSFALWNAYAIAAWPTQLFFDRHGHLRTTIVGDSQDAAVRAAVDALLAER
ncbi:MAG: redoxin domain-containing protein [Candidatus Tumulicola sp.]